MRSESRSNSDHELKYINDNALNVHPTVIPLQLHYTIHYDHGSIKAGSNVLL